MAKLCLNSIISHAGKCTVARVKPHEERQTGDVVRAGDILATSALESYTQRVFEDENDSSYFSKAIV